MGIDFFSKVVQRSFSKEKKNVCVLVDMALTTEGGRCEDYEDMAGELLETHTGLGCRVESLLW